MTHYGANHQPRVVLHQDVWVVGPDGCSFALLEQTGTRICARLMRIVTAPLAFPVRVGIASATCLRFIVRAILGTRALLADLWLNQRGVH
jgi:hypothetical protein